MEQSFGETLYTSRITGAKPSFIREILKVAGVQDVISFAGGLPNPISFPKNEMEESSKRVLLDSESYQYAQTEGYAPLREFIANRYHQRFDMGIEKEDILITTGSQQGLDLFGKVLIEKGSGIVIEKPGYLGAIQAFSMFEPEFIAIDMDEEGMKPDALEKALQQGNVKLIYTVPNFQNPSGITYSQKRRTEIRKIVEKYSVFLIEDDPYGELRFWGEDLPYIGNGYRGSAFFGSFSKTLSPGMRVGYVCTKNKKLLNYLAVAKQGTDLHTSIMTQRFIYDYLIHNDYDAHIEVIRKLYTKQSEAMYQAAIKYFPENVTITHPDGGMFMWADMEACGVSARKLIEKAMKENVLFVPGDSFYTEECDPTTLRLNFTNSNIEEIKRGIQILGHLMQKMRKKQ